MSTLSQSQRRALGRAVELVGGFRAAERLAPLSDRCLRKAANDPDATFRNSTLKDIERTIEILRKHVEGGQPTPESKLDRIERKLDLIIKHLGLA